MTKICSEIPKYAATLPMSIILFLRYQRETSCIEMLGGGRGEEYIE